MNEYCRHSIRKFHLSYQQRSFDQDDVSIFLLMSRDYTKKGSVFRELGDFLAHPEEKDRGLVIKAIEEMVPKIDAFLIDDHKNQKMGVDDFSNMPMFNGLRSAEIAKELAEVLIMAGIDGPEINEESDSFSEFISCIILLLGSCSLLVNGQSLRFKVTYGHCIEASVSYESHRYINTFADLPVLSARNINKSWHGALNRSIEVTGLIARRHKSGSLIGVSHANDLSPGFTEREEYASGEAWALTTEK